jgi:hypothetical protein
MNDVDIRIRYASLRSPAQLAVSTPLGFETAARIWGVLHSSRVTPAHSRLVRVGERLELAARLTEHDGSRLSQERMGELLEALRTALTRSEARAELVPARPGPRSAVSLVKPGRTGGDDAEGCQACA